MTDSHTYVNTKSATAKTADTTDIDFLTDANVYYNLPPPLPVGHCRGASLPRGRYAAQHQLMRASSSCPASPKLTSAAAAAAPVPIIDVNSREKGEGEALARPAKPPFAITARRNDATQENGRKDEPLPSLKAREVPKPRSKMLPHTRSFDLDHIYQNLVRVATKPRSNSFSIDLPWKRRKKVVDATPPDIREDSGEDSHIGLGQNQPGASKPEPPREPSLSLSKSEHPRESTRQSVSMPEPPREPAPMLHGDQNPQVLNSTNSSSSSSSSNNSNNENDCDAEDCSAGVRPSVTYVRRQGQRKQVGRSSSSGGEVVNALYHCTATLPLHSRSASSPVDTAKASVDQRPMLDVNANLDEWLRKERWLEKKRCSRNFRSSNESGEVDISILHASDGDKWKNYLYEVFTHLVPGDDRARGIRVEASNVEEIEENLGKLQAVKLKGSKLQIVIMSPCFLDHVANHGKSELGQVFKPEKVLALLLGVDNSQLTMAHLSALYSYCDWHKLKVRDMDPSFVDEVLTEGIKILNNSELYSKYQDERNARFKVTPRKVTELQQLVHLLLNDPVYTKKDIEILIESPSKPNVTVEKFRLRNPYTIEFRMPDEFLASSSLVLVTVLVQKQHIGSRQVKCESSLDSVRSHLTILTDPTIFMCQALNINHASNQLDQKMTEAVKTQVPLCKLKEKRKEKCYSEFPTMVHFSAYYGLEQLTWTLLEIPGGEAALNVPNQNGHTPSVLAYQKGFHLFAHTLEDAALMASLAEKLNYEPLHYKNISKARSTNIAQELYSSPPPPRPLNSPLYDHPPSPQEVLKHTVGSSSVEVPQCGPAVDDTSSSVSELCSPPPPPYPCEHNLFSTSLTTAAQTEERKQDGRYLDMKATQDFRETELYEYSEDVYTLVTAWLEKTNMKAFVETHQEKIDEVKSKLDLNTTKEEYYNPENTPGASAEVTAQEADKNMVEQFCTLLRDVLSESKCELPTCTATASQEVSEEQLEKISSSSESAGLKIIPNMMPPAYSIEERPPQPPPRPYCQGEYLKPEDLNALTNTLVIGSTESNTGVPRYYNTTLRRSSSAERGTHCQDQTAEMLYAIVK
ncbi:uncharacterized protein LOC123505658 isoform X2 [Portunus trituberculatus]|uniref:uncharacterized protein LOC123505658 isoform X2 n=1 Tax=Portunus trituberculatus TaxID=210409 RepID=UPI001E1D0CFC|nr:uncharacterized protein LOC123505658 isoform X2 [Portunus trituberculatus]